MREQIIATFPIHTLVIEKCHHLGVPSDKMLNSIALKIFGDCQSEGFVVLLLKLTRWVDSEGFSHWDEMRPQVASLLNAIEPHLRERLTKRPDATGRVAARDPDLGSAWEGAHLRFRWLLGESRTWWGDPVVKVNGVRHCTVCGGAWLPRYAYCLSCDRSGADDATATATARAVLPSRPHGEDRLKGGLAGKR